VVAHLPPAALSAGPGELARRSLAGVLVALLLALWVRTFLCQLVLVPSGSMAPALFAGDRLLVDRLRYGGGAGPLARLLPMRDPAAGDVVVFRSPEEHRRLLVKRCVAVGGAAYRGGYVPAGTLALEGDAAGESHDSRAFGPVERRALVGRGVAVLWSVAPGAGLAGLRGGRTLARVR